jgi:hypothetical protein
MMCPPDLLPKIILVVPAAFNLMQRFYSGAEIRQENIMYPHRPFLIIGALR